MKHSENCLCPACEAVRQSTPPKLVGDFYHTKTRTMQVVSIGFDGACWIVRYVVKKRGIWVDDGSDYTQGGNWHTVKNWNIYCRAWRRDLCPEGIPNKGWRAGENNQ